MASLEISGKVMTRIAVTHGGEIGGGLTAQPKIGMLYLWLLKSGEIHSRDVNATDFIQLAR